MLMNFAFLAAYCIFSMIHLYASKKKNRKLRSYTKGFLLPSLLGLYCCTVSTSSALVLMALLTSWLGDVLLIPRGAKWFAAGGIFFLLSHVFFCLCYAPQIVWARISVWTIPAIAAAYVAAVCLLFRRYRPHLPKPLYYPMFLYLLTNGAMNCFALFQLLSLPCPATVITYVGALLFFASDVSLFSVRFNKNSPFKSHFFIMLTYLFAEYMIVQGLILLG